MRVLWLLLKSKWIHKSHNSAKYMRRLVKSMLPKDHCKSSVEAMSVKVWCYCGWELHSSDQHQARLDCCPACSVHDTSIVTSLFYTIVVLQKCSIRSLQLIDSLLQLHSDNLKENVFFWIDDFKTFEKQNAINCYKFRKEAAFSSSKLIEMLILCSNLFSFLLRWGGNIYN